MKSNYYIPASLGISLPSTPSAAGAAVDANAMEVDNSHADMFLLPSEPAPAPVYTTATSRGPPVQMFGIPGDDDENADSMIPSMTSTTPASSLLPQTQPAATASAPPKMMFGLLDSDDES
jgi:hypothetical protein